MQCKTLVNLYTINTTYIPIKKKQNKTKKKNKQKKTTKKTKTNKQTKKKKKTKQKKKKQQKKPKRSNNGDVANTTHRMCNAFPLQRRHNQFVEWSL